MIFKMARDRTDDGRDVKRCAVIKDNNGRLITESTEALRIWAANFKELLYGEAAASCIEIPRLVRREVEVEEIGQEEVETAQYEKGKATGADELRLETLEMAGELGVKWTGKSTERVYAGGKDIDRVEDVPGSADMEEERGCE